MTAVRNLGGRPRTVPLERIAAARALWDEGLTGREIALRLGVTKSVIDGISYREVFPMRKAGRRRRGEDVVAGCQ